MSAGLRITAWSLTAVAHGDHCLSALVVVKEMMDRRACLLEYIVGRVGPRHAEALACAVHSKWRLNLSVAVENSVGETGFSSVGTRRSDSTVSLPSTT
jgi:hypothetical protein